MRTEGRQGLLQGLLGQSPHKASWHLLGRPQLHREQDIQHPISDTEEKLLSHAHRDKRVRELTQGDVLVDVCATVNLELGQLFLAVLGQLLACKSNVTGQRDSVHKQ